MIYGNFSGLYGTINQFIYIKKKNKKNKKI